MVRALLALLLVGLLAGCGASGQPAEFSGSRLDPPFEVSSTSLTDADGAPFSLTKDTDKPLTLVFFGYTFCPDICGQVMRTLAGTVARLDDADRDRVDVVFVTTDPHRDTRQVVTDYTAMFDDTFIGLDGDLADIVEVARSMKVAIGYFDSKGREIAPEDLPDSGYDVEHGTQVFAIDANDDVTAFWRQDVSQAMLAHDIDVLLDEG